MQELKKKKESNIDLIKRVAITGFFAGIIWPTLWAILNYFNFTELSPSSFVLELVFDAKWISRWYGQIISILFLSLMSILVAYIYYWLFRKLTGILPGIIYGVVLWLLLILISSSLFVHIPSLNEQNVNTIVTMLALFILYGVFVGYTISYDFLDQS
ncbi:YqhR family membrane protein [Amphibacillus xylanus]|uniref:Uncharacterized protein n=1 Tax=Amphibacillus xylanus (strain ATCC 51415 / DSM 6626 / JCM 7361 / LMG 17667 / NBRC 15112 / Ep01) TaxID=698758 RepID=K0J2B1_AMPXN|nr:YqhR family membrane protein [Amphibacillus xylanus]BAM47292.1 hypothetical protein AXY_11600 [Amphibacillus xylanus NBRC 15112]